MRMNMTMSMRFSSNLRRVFTRRHAEHHDARAPPQQQHTTAYHLVR